MRQNILAGENFKPILDFSKQIALLVDHMGLLIIVKMSFLAKIFGFGDSKEVTPAEAVEQEKKQSVDTTKKISDTIDKLEITVEGLNIEILALEKEAKALITSKNKQKAMLSMKKIKGKKDKLIKVTKQIAHLENVKFNLENENDDSEFFEAIRQANKVAEARAKRHEEHLDVMARMKELNDEYKQQQEQMNEYLEIDDAELEDLDTLYEQYAEELRQETGRL